MDQSVVDVLSAGGSLAASGASSLGDAQRWPALGLPASVDWKGGRVIPIGLDNGNDAAKVAIVAPDGALLTLRVPTATMPAKTIRSGEREPAYSVGDLTLWIGDTALRHGGDELPIGTTAARLADDRLRAYLAAVLAEALATAGYTPGVYSLLLGFSIPDEEIESDDDAKDMNKVAVRADTKKALAEHVRGQVWAVTRTDKAGVVTTWQLQVAAVLPQPQTAGTVLAYTKAPNGKTVIERDRLLVVNIGGGDTFESEVSTKPFQMSSSRISAGTIDMARALWRRLGETERNDAAAQYALRTHRALRSGSWEDISDEVSAIQRSVGQTLLTRVLANALHSRQFVLLTGGGVIPLHDQIEARMREAEPPRVRGKQYDVINHGLSSVLNAIGALLAVAFAASARRN